MTITPISILQNKHAHVFARWEKAVNAAKAMAKGDVHEEVIAEYISTHFDTTNRRSPAEIDSDALQTWADWTAMQGYAVIDFLRLELERPTFVRIKTMFDEAATPVNADAAKARPPVVAELTRQYEDVMAALDEIGHPRQDVKDAFASVMAGPHDEALRRITTKRSADMYELSRYERVLDASLDAARSMVRANESDMAFVFLLAAARRAQRGIVDFNPARAMKDVRTQGQTSFKDLKHCSFYLNANAGNLARYAQLAAKLETPPEETDDNRSFPPLRLNIN